MFNFFTEFIIFGSKIQPAKLNKSFPANILGNFLSPVGVVRNIGVWFDTDFSFSRYIQSICKSFFIKSGILSISDITSHIMPPFWLLMLWLEVDLTYCKSLFRSLSALDLRKLQCIHNSLAGIVTNTTKYSHISPVRKIVHWLPIEHCSIFKTALLVYKFLIVVIQNILHLFLNPDKVSTTHAEAKLMVCSLRFATSLYKSSKPLALSFAYDTTKIWYD